MNSSGVGVAPHLWTPRGWRLWICHHCYAPRFLHPRTGWTRARPLRDNRRKDPYETMG